MLVLPNGSTDDNVDEVIEQLAAAGAVRPPLGYCWRSHAQQIWWASRSWKEDLILLFLH